MNRRGQKERHLLNDDSRGSHLWAPSPVAKGLQVLKLGVSAEDNIAPICVSKLGIL